LQLSHFDKVENGSFPFKSSLVSNNTYGFHHLTVRIVQLILLWETIKYAIEIQKVLKRLASFFEISPKDVQYFSRFRFSIGQNFSVKHFFSIYIKTHTRVNICLKLNDRGCWCTKHFLNPFSNYKDRHSKSTNSPSLTFLHILLFSLSQKHMTWNKVCRNFLCKMLMKKI